MERLARVEPSVRRLIEAASIIGSDIRIDDLLAMHESPLEEQLEALDHALKTSFLHRRATSHVSFRHALIRDIVADGLSIADARRYHARIARRFGDRGEPAAAIAHHWARAGDEPQAAEWNERAGDDALNVFAYLDAAQFFRRAAELTSNRLLRPQLRERASDALTMNGSTRAALREKAIALELYRELERSEDFLRVATGMIACSATDISYVASKRASRIAIAEAKRLAIPNMSCAAFVSAADHLRIAGHDKRTSVLLGRASPLVSQASLINISRYHDVAGKTAVGRLDNASARDHFTAAREVAERTGDLALVIRVVSNQAEFLQRVLEYDQALIIWRDLYRLAKERTFGWRIPFAALGLADMLILRGEFAEAAPLVDEALERGLECDQLRIQAGSIGTRLGLFLNRPDLIERCALDEWLESAFRIRDSAYLSPIAGAFVELALARGDDARAARIVSRYCKTAVGAMLSERMLPFVGLFGSDADIANAERLLGEMPPFIALLRASAAQRRGRASEAHVYSSTAELGFTRLALMEFAMIAHRISGKRARDVPSSDTVLTPREREICVEVAKGESNRAIADRLGISIKTVGHHLESIYARLGVEGRAKLIAYLNAMSQHSAA
jgi:DNA-binding CsgD family transcriptional regulator